MNQNQVLLAKSVCTNKEFDLVEWLSMCLHKIYITTQYKTNSATAQRSKKFKKSVQGGIAIYSSCKMLHNNSAKKKESEKEKKRERETEWCPMFIRTMELNSRWSDKKKTSKQKLKNRKYESKREGRQADDRSAAHVCVCVCGCACTCACACVSLSIPPLFS